MTAPERIWAWEYKGNSPWGEQKPDLNVVTNGAEYIRADLAAVQPAQPDPRDEVIARLVEAAEQFLIEYDEVDLAVPEPQSMVSAVMEARAALAAAKAVQP